MTSRIQCTRRCQSIYVYNLCTHTHTHTQSSEVEPLQLNFALLTSDVRSAAFQKIFRKKPEICVSSVFCACVLCVCLDSRKRKNESVCVCVL